MSAENGRVTSTTERIIDQQKIVHIRFGRIEQNLNLLLAINRHVSPETFKKNVDREIETEKRASPFGLIIKRVSKNPTDCDVYDFAVHDALALLAKFPETTDDEITNVLETIVQKHLRNCRHKFYHILYPQ